MRLEGAKEGGDEASDDGADKDNAADEGDDAVEQGAHFREDGRDRGASDDGSDILQFVIED